MESNPQKQKFVDDELAEHLSKKMKVSSEDCKRKRDEDEMKELSPTKRQNFDPNQNLKFKNVPDLYTAIISDDDEISIKSLVQKYPHFEFKNEDCLPLHVSESAPEGNKIDVLELIGATCILTGDSFAQQKYGWTCWDEAMNFRIRSNVPKPQVTYSELEKLALRLKIKSEIQNSTELNNLLKQRKIHWKTQAFLVTQRILKENNGPANIFAISNLYQFALKDWKSRKLDRSCVVALSLYIMELCSNFISMNNSIPSKLFQVINSTLKDLYHVLKDKRWTASTVCISKTVLTIDHLIQTLEFCCKYQMQANDFWFAANDKKDKNSTQISDLIILILELLDFLEIPKTQTAERRRLAICLNSYIKDYEFDRAPHKTNLLVKICQINPKDVQSRDFMLVNLLLQLGSNTTSVDCYSQNALYLLAEREFCNRYIWRNSEYLQHARNFTAVVKTFLDQTTYHDDQVNMGKFKTSLECLKTPSRRSSKYPDPEFHALMANVLKGPRPLSCLAAKTINNNPVLRLAAQNQPETFQHLQSFINLH